VKVDQQFELKNRQLGKPKDFKREILRLSCSDETKKRAIEVIKRNEDECSLHRDDSGVIPVAEYLKEMQSSNMSIEVKDSISVKPDKMAVTMFIKDSNTSICGLNFAKPQTRQLNLREGDVMASTHYDSARGRGLSTNSSAVTHLKAPV